MKQTKTHILVWALVITLLASCLPLSGWAQSVSVKDDFYQAINGEWLASAVIPPDRFSVGGLLGLSFDMLDQLMLDSDKMLSGEITPDNELLKQYAAFYALCADYDKRNADGIEPLKPYLARIEALDSLEALNADAADLLLSGITLPFGLIADIDFGDARKYVLCAAAPSLLLPDVSYYDEGNPAGPVLLGAFADISKQALALAGYSAEDAARITEQVIAFDALLVPYTKTAVESSELKNLYNPVELSKFCADHKTVDFASLIGGLTKVPLDRIVLYDAKFYDAFDEIVCQDNFELIKSWMLYQAVAESGIYLSEPIQVLTGSMADMLTGRTEPISRQRQAYRTASTMFSAVVGDYYGRTYFGEEAKADVTGMVENLIEVFKKRLENSAILGEETRAMAIKKLSATIIHVGYPERIDPVYEKLIVTPASQGGTLLDNAMHFIRIRIEDNFAKLGTPVDRDEWAFSADTVSAGHLPQSNAIEFPAAILQAPFYSLEQSASTNYGGIGAFIGHEITHAFDPNGALFDEYGSMANWWTDEDKAQFDKKAQEMVQLFDGLPYLDTAINGELTKTENIADAGGLSCALEVVKSLPDCDLDAFFTGWAVAWRAKYTPEIEKLIIASDPHSPDKLRVNRQLPLLQEFYDTYDIREGDGMYIAPEQRVSIW